MAQPREQRWAEGTFRAVLDSAPDAIVGVAPSGEIVLVNAQAERLFGWHRDELLGQSVDLLVPDAARRVHPAHRKRYLAHARPRPMGAGMRLAARRRDGSEFPAEISLSAVETEDGLLVSAAVRDVSDRLEAEAERARVEADAERDRMAARLTQAERLESLGQLAGGVAHDFNNLLAVIANYASFVDAELEQAVREPGGERWQQVVDDVKQVRMAADRATALTHQLLAFGRREVVQPKVLDLDEVVVGVEQILRRTLGEHIQLVVDLAATPVRVVADPGQVEQVLMNLAVNARDVMPTGGTLTITTEVVAERTVPGSDHDGPWAALRVRDTGSGMAPEVQARAFEPFFTTKPRGAGSGLGLATVYGVITQAGGTVAIDSATGQGTMVTCLLPLTDEPVAEVPSATAGARRRGGETVLVVEDEDALRQVTERILRANGHPVLTAATGADAVALADQHEDPVHLLLTDVVMPHMLGTEVAERVLAVRPGIRVLFMSGYAHATLTEQGTLPEGVHLLAKPFSEEDLLAEVRRVLDEP